MTEEHPAALLWPGDRIRRGRDLFLIGTVAVSNDAVRVMASLRGEPEREIRLAPGEIVRVETSAVHFAPPKEGKLL